MAISKLDKVEHWDFSHRSKCGAYTHYKRVWVDPEDPDQCYWSVAQDEAARIAKADGRGVARIGGGKACAQIVEFADGWFAIEWDGSRGDRYYRMKWQSLAVVHESKTELREDGTRFVPYNGVEVHA
jgi:hypothetical protein